MKPTLDSTSRRRFCQGTAVGLASALTGVPVSNLFGQEAITEQQAFASSFQNIPESFGPHAVTFDRPLPSGLQGTLYRNGPARMQRGDTTYHHWFDGDGMVHAFELNSKSVTHHAKMVVTDRSKQEAAAGRFLRSGFGTSFNDSLPVNNPDDLNVANISVLPLGDEVLALWEAGSAWRLDADTLETLGRKVFSPETDGLPFSAHPRVDPQGRIWNFGYLSGSGKLVLYDINPNGALNRVSVVDAPNADMVHDFAITDRYLIFVLQPLHFKLTGKSGSAYVENLHWDDKGSVQVLVIDKENLLIANQFELPAFFAFHMGNAWQDGSTIRIEVATEQAFKPLMEQIVKATTAQPLVLPPSRPGAMEIQLDMTNKRATLNTLPGTGIDFPRFDQRFTGQQTQHLFMLGRSREMSPAIFGFNSVTAIDRKTDSARVFNYDADTIAEEHLFVAAAGREEGKGWLVGTSYNWRKGLTYLSVFNAQHIEDGPLSQAELPYSLPLGLHGQFVPA